jgi:Protein of unknown function (DUF2842)
VTDPDWRKPVGVLLILALIAVWSVIIVSLSGRVGSWPVLAQALFYLVAGIVWIAPLKPLLAWIETGRFKP